MSIRNSIAALVAISSMACVSAAEPTAQAVRPDTSNAVSLDPGAPNSYRNFAPELAKTVERMPQLDPATGLHVKEIKPDLFYVTDGVYQSAFVRTGQGVIVVDAPPSFAEKLPAVIAQQAKGERVKYLLYSHGHADHVGGSSTFKAVEGLRIVAQESVAEAIKRERNPGILVPNETFADEHSISLGRQVVKLKAAHYHSENTDTIIYLPQRKFIVAVDTITPGEAPFMNFGATSRFGGYVDFFDEILKYDFDTILSGHVSILGTRDDVLVARDYVHDVRDIAMKGMEGFLPDFEKTFAAFDHKNGNLAYRVAMRTSARIAQRKSSTDGRTSFPWSTSGRTATARRLSCTRSCTSMPDGLLPTELAHLDVIFPAVVPRAHRAFSAGSAPMGSTS